MSISASQTDSPVVEKIVWQRKLRAFLMTSLAVFALITFFWALSIDGYESHSEVKLGLAPEYIASTDVMAPEPDMQGIAERFQGRVDKVWRTEISDRKLSYHAKQIADSSGLINDSLKSGDFATLRKRLACDLTLREKGKQLSLRLSLKGQGSIDEVELVERITQSIATEVAMIPLRTQPIDSTPLDNQLKRQLDRARWLAGQIDNDLDTIRTELSEAGDAVAVNYPDMDNDNDSMRQLLAQKVADLESEKDHLLNLYEDDHFEVTALTSQIAAVKTQIAELDLPSADSDDSWESPFQSASFKPELNKPSGATVPLDRIQRSIDSIDVDSLKATLTAVDSAANEATELANPVVSHPPIYVQGVRETESQPINGMPSGASVLTFLTLSALIGSIVAWRFQPLYEDQGFKDLNSVTSTLNVPVLTAFNHAESAEPDENDQPASNLVVQLSEFVVFAILFIIACGLLFSPTIRAAFADNPFHGLSRLIWTITGK